MKRYRLTLRLNAVQRADGGLDCVSDLDLQAVRQCRDIREVEIALIDAALDALQSHRQQLLDDPTPYTEKDPPCPSPSNSTN